MEKECGEIRVDGRVQTFMSVYLYFCEKKDKTKKLFFIFSLNDMCYH